MPPSKTKPGTRKLSDVARHVVVPEGIVATGYPAVAAKCRDMGIVHDDWQQGLGRLALGKRADGKYAATVGGVVLSIPRQVGKTFTVGSIIFALCMLFPGMTVIWTAHRARMSNETFRAMQGMARRLKVKPHIASIRQANGEQEITFHNGSRIMFGAREQGFGRGFSEVDVIVFDEAQILTERALDDMVATTNQSRHPAGALLFYMGTPPKPTDPGEAFTNKRVKALANKAKHSGAPVGDTVYVELAADENADPDDRKQWAVANPSYPKHTPVESMLRLRENLVSLESWLREGLGIWDDDGSKSPIQSAAWSRLGDTAEQPAPHVGRIVLAVDADPLRQRTTISACGRGADGVPLVEMLENLPGVDWAEAYVKDLCAAHDIAAVVIDKRGAAATLIQPLTDAHLPVVGTDAAQMAQACGLFITAVNETAHLRHISQIELNAAVRAAITRPLGDAIAWDRKKPTVDITPLTSATLAHWGLLTSQGVAKNAGRGRVIAL